MATRSQPQGTWWLEFGSIQMIKANYYVTVLCECWKNTQLHCYNAPH